jgi:hypothetical protein
MEFPEAKCKYTKTLKQFCESIVCSLFHNAFSVTHTIQHQMKG